MECLYGSLGLCVYVCVQACLLVVCVFVFLCLCMNLRVCVWVCMCLGVHVFTFCACVCVFMFTFKRVFLHSCVCICLCMWVCTWVCLCERTQIAQQGQTLLLLSLLFIHFLYHILYTRRVAEKRYPRPFVDQVSTHHIAESHTHIHLFIHIHTLQTT